MTFRGMQFEAKNETDAAFQAGLATAEPISGNDGGSYLVVPEGWELHRVGEEPLFISEKRMLHDVTSFVSYVERYYVAGQSIVLCAPNGTLRAIFDYHRDTSTSGREPGRGLHHAVFEPERTRSWLAWARQSGKPMTQTDFLEFLENRIGDIAEPNLSEIIRHFQVRSNVGYSRAENLTDGTVQLHYTEDAEAMGGVAGTIRIPTSFTIVLKPFRDMDSKKVFTAKLRWRLTKPQVQFTFILNEEELEDYSEEVNRERAALVEGSGFQVLFGI